MREYVKVSEDFSFNLTKKEKEQYTIFLKKEIMKFYKKNFPQHVDDLLKVKINISNKLSKQLGQFKSLQRVENGVKTPIYNQKTELLFSGKGIKVYALDNKLDEYFTKIVIHEVLHMYLYYRCEDFRDGSYLFESLLSKFGTSSSSKTKAELRQANTLRVKHIQYRYSCGCNENENKYYYYRKVSNLMCSTCKYNLKYDGKFVG